MSEAAILRYPLRNQLRFNNEKYPTTTVEIISNGTIPGYRVGGVEQRAGDKSRCQIRDAERLQKVGKARIVPGSEKTELL